MKIWAILGARRGDNNQVLALAESLGRPFEIKQLSYNRLRFVGPKLLGASLLSLTRPSRALILDGEPDLTISTGHRSVPVVQALRKRSRGRTRSVHLNYPRISPANFDLVVATPEYPIDDHPNLLRIPFCLTRAGNRAGNHDETDREFWRAHPTPRRLLILGGPTLYWRLSPETVRRSLDVMLAMTEGENGSLLVVGSPRTPSDLLSGVRQQIDRAKVPATLCPLDGPPSYSTLLRNVDTITITADSVAMISEAHAA
jgi:mitochondrial fission protein ELM1